ncbi:MAG TPA: hypothetical protein PKK06_01205 [Phycisphaerae bacterium]|nr:hypothetical protein [Phycisphaerae bacterium]HNU43774.1 hypothetical protein [Phycisphaerae bacterium]
MGRNVRFIILNSDEQFGRELRALLLSFDGVKIVAEVDEPALLHQTVRQCQVDILIVHLDPTPETILPVAGEIAAAERNLAVFAVSSSTDGQLILNVLRKGLREFLPRPIDPKTLGEAIDRVVAQQGEHVKQGRLITVLGAAGGVGATFLATNLAVELRQLAAGAVAVVDMDYRFGQVATLLDVEVKYTLADLCHSPEALEAAVLQRALEKHSSGVHVLSRPSHFAQADTMTASACVALLSGLLQFNEYVVTDGPNRFDLTAKSVLDFSDVTLLVVQLLVPPVRNALRIIEGLREAGFGRERLRLVCNRAGRESGHLSLQDVESTLGLEASVVIPDDWATVSGAINLGEPLLEHGPRSKVRAAIQELAQRLHNPQGPSDEKKKEEAGKGSLLNKIFSRA